MIRGGDKLTVLNERTGRSRSRFLSGADNWFDFAYSRPDPGSPTRHPLQIELFVAGIVRYLMICHLVRQDLQVIH